MKLLSRIAVLVLLFMLIYPTSARGEESRKIKTDLYDIAQYAPVALPWAIKLSGGDTRSGWGRMAASQGTGALLMCGSVWGLKHFVHETRPDGVDDRSFPSGHSAWAFMGATMTGIELGWRSPWYSVGSYAFASAIAMQRIVDRRHFPGDVLGGMGIGVVAGCGGYLIADAIFGNRRICDKYRLSHGDAEISSNFGVTSGVSIPLRSIEIGEVTVVRSVAYFSALDANLMINDNLSVGAQLSATTSMLKLDGASLPEIDGINRPLTEIGITANTGYSSVLNDRFVISAHIGIGCLLRPHMHFPHRYLSAATASPAGNLSLTGKIPVTDRWSLGAIVGYEMSGYDFTLGAGDDLQSARGVDHRLNIGLSSIVVF